MNFIWHIMLTVCLESHCIKQDVQWFESKADCEHMLKLYADIPPDGDWTTIKYECKPVSSISS